MPNRRALRESRQAELRDLLAEAQAELPGVFDLVQAYGDCEEAMRTVKAYLEPTHPEPFVTTSNQAQTIPEV